MQMNHETEKGFGSHVFSDKVMRERLPKEVYHKIKKTVEQGIPLDSAAAEVIAGAMKDWALELGATHYTHWFSPMNGQTAEKHDAFVSPMQDGTVIYEFSGKALVRGEADASSFPSGGLRATFEARGYTAWDCTSPVFIKRDPGGVVALCIPTVFLSFNGEALDTRIPLLRSMTALNTHALRVLKAIGDTETSRVFPNVGLEQEYFLIDRGLYKKRRDLIYTGRTLFGARPPKGQEMDDQYYASIRQRVSAFMAELNEELWRLGVPAKTQHNEVAPAQHELAVLYDSAVAACDQNQLTMTILKKVAARRDLACLIHEKPFNCVSGSGKHNNWSMGTDLGKNLLEPGKDPAKNKSFLLFFAAVISAVHSHAELLRFSCAGLSNDYRLGGHEAPIPVISVFTGDEFYDVLAEAAGEKILKHDPHGDMHLGVGSLANLHGDNTDRNRTSPFAFTGNKFEFRMPGSSQCGNTTNAIINTIVAQQLDNIATRLEGAADVEKEIGLVLRDLFKAHRAILFNGDNYAAKWHKEAAERGLPCLASTVDAIPALTSEKAVALFEKYRVLSMPELDSRSTIAWDTYIKLLRVEAQTLLDMQRKLVLPVVLKHQAQLARDIQSVEAVGVPAQVQRECMEKIAPLSAALYGALKNLEKALTHLSSEPSEKTGRAWHDMILPGMDAVRNASDALEMLVPGAMWPVPTYGELLFYV